MQKLDLTTTIQGIRDGKNKTHDCRYSLITAKKGGITQAQMSIDTFEGAGSTYKELENPHIEIYFPGFEMWKGTAAELREFLKVKPN
jgi:hypothetical protein